LKKVLAVGNNYLFRRSVFYFLKKQLELLKSVAEISSWRYYRFFFKSDLTGVGL